MEYGAGRRDRWRGPHSKWSRVALRQRTVGAICCESTRSVHASTAVAATEKQRPYAMSFWNNCGNFVLFSYFELTVSDNGKGISESQKGKVFDMFFTGTNGKSIGSGIGLHIVKEAVAKINGAIALESEEGVGSNFIITAPLSNE